MVNVFGSMTFVVLVVVRFVMRHEQKTLLVMIEESTESGQYHVSSEIITCVTKPLWTPSPFVECLPTSFNCHSEPGPNQVADTIREVNNYCARGERVKFDGSLQGG